MAGSACNFGALVRHVANEGGPRGRFVIRKTRQTTRLLFFVRKL
jgi:hypothetical protein